MKAPILFFVVAGLLAAACEQKSGTSATSAAAGATNTTQGGVSAADAPGGYLKALAQGQQSAVKTVDTTALDKAIQLFNVDQGRNPMDLNELVQKKYIPQIPTPPYGTKLVYDASAGTVKVEKQ